MKGDGGELQLVIDTARDILSGRGIRPGSAARAAESGRSGEAPPQDGGTSPDGDGADRIWRQFEDAGFLLMAVPEPAGGGWLEAAAAVARLCGELTAPVPYADAAVVAAPLLAGAGLELPAGLVTAADIVTPGGTAPSGMAASGMAAGGMAAGGTAPSGMAAGGTAAGRAWAHAERAGDRLRLRAELPYVAWGSAASAVAVVVSDGGGELVAALDPSSAEIVAGRNLAGEPRDLLRFDVEVPPGRWATASPGAAFELRLRGALARSLAMSGAAATALAMTLRYARERVQFGRPIARFQAVQHAIAELAVEVEAMRASADAAVAACAHSGFGSASARIAVAAAKVQAGRGGAVVARVAHQVHGAIGTTREHPLHRVTTRLWAWRDDFGSERAWQDDLAGATLGADPWEAITQ